MGSVNALSPNNAAVYNIGRRYVIASGVPFSRSRSSVATNPLFARSAAELGTQPDVNISQRSVLQIIPQQKIAQSTTDTLVSRGGTRYIPVAAIEEEIANKPISQHGVVHTGNRQVVRNSDADTLIARENN
jgi:hypothetical protein